MRRQLGFWVRRYGPAELAASGAMLVASAVLVRLTTSTPVLAAGAMTAAWVGFYAVLVVAVGREQRRVLRRGERWFVLRLVTRTVLLLAAEFGTADLLDTFLWRPALMVAAVVVVDDPFWGLLLGKTLADILFYGVSALGYRVTEMSGVRRRPAREPDVSHI